jgi:hypothetical protein
MKNCNCTNLAGWQEAAATVVPGATQIFTNILDEHNAIRDLYPECGTRPFFVGRRRREYEECISQYPPRTPGAGGQAPGAGGQAPGRQGTRPGATETREEPINFLQKYQTPLLIGGGLLAAYLIFRPKK